MGDMELLILLGLLAVLAAVRFWLSMADGRKAAAGAGKRTRQTSGKAGRRQYRTAGIHAGDRMLSDHRIKRTAGRLCTGLSK